MTDQLPNRTADNDMLEKETMRWVIWRILPLLVVNYLVSTIDQGNTGVVALWMNRDLGLSKAASGFVSSLYLVAYFILEVSSNLVIQKVGACLRTPRIMTSWGMVSMCMALVQNTTSLYIVRFLLGTAEAGFFPGAMLYFAQWIPSCYRAHITVPFMAAIPLANFIGSPLSGLILILDGWSGLHGWHLLFIVGGLPAMSLGIVALFILRDRPHQAVWLNDWQKTWLENTLQVGRQQQKQTGHITTWQLSRHHQIWLVVLTYADASSAGITLSVWSPQLLRSFHPNNLATGLLSAIPYGPASVLMVVWGRSSDRNNERRWYMAFTLSIIAASVFTAFIDLSLPATIMILSTILIGAYAVKDPFQALASGWMSSTSATTGLATIGAIANPIDGAMMANAYGITSERTGSHMLAILPLTILCLIGDITALAMEQRYS